MSDIIEVIKDVTTVTIASDGPQGPAGPTGPTGPEGAAGAPGSSGVISVVAPITNTGTSTSAIIGINSGVANGVATLDSNGKVPQSQIPAVAITNTFVVASQAAMLALTAEEGDVAVRTDQNKTYILTATPSSTLANWQELLTPTDTVTSVDGRIGTVTLTDKYAQLATANTFTGAQTANSFIPTSSTVPTNGVYLPAANTLGLATNSTSVLQIGSTGKIGIGTTPPSATSINLASNITGSSTSNGLRSAGTVMSDVTNAAFYYVTNANTTAASFTVPEIRHYNAIQGSFGAGSTVTQQIAFMAESSLIGATSNLGFYGNIPSGTNRWNFYANGTAANYFAGQTTVGSTSLTLGASSAAQQFGVVSTAATNIAVVIRGAASQTGDLTQWQNSSAGVLASVNSSGTFIGSNGFRVPNGSFYQGTRNTGSATVNIMGFASGTDRIDFGGGTSTGDIFVFNNSGGGTRFRVNNSGQVLGDASAAPSFGGGTGVVNILNATTVPSSNPTGGGVLYVESGALKYRGSSGTVTTLGAA